MHWLTLGDTSFRPRKAGVPVRKPTTSCGPPRDVSDCGTHPMPVSSIGSKARTGYTSRCMSGSDEMDRDSARLRTPSHAAPEKREPKPAGAPTSVAMLAIVLIGLMAILKLGTGLLIGSVALLSEGLHTLIDLFAAIVSYFTVRAASQPADWEHRYGHGKIENIAGIAQAAFIFIPTLIIVARAINGLIRLETVLSSGRVDIGTGIMGLTILVNIYLALRLLSVARAHKSEAIRAAAFHQLNDLWTSIGVFIALALIWYNPNLKILDPLVALGVTAISVWMAWSLCRESVWNLLDRAAGSEIDDAVLATLNRNKPLARGYHNLRTRRAGSTVYVDIHVEVCGELSFREAHEITEKIEGEISEDLDGADVIIHADPCTEDCEHCDLNRERRLRVPDK